MIKKRLRNGWLGLVAIVVALFLAEGVLRLARFPTDPFPPEVLPPHLDHTFDNLEYRMPVRTNAWGLRGEDLPDKKQAGASRIFVAGDSYTFGTGVPQEATFVALLEEYQLTAGQPTCFINGGKPGAGPWEYARIFSRIGRQLDPDGLLLVLYANDLVNTPVAMRDTLSWTEQPPVERSGWRAAVHALLPRLYTVGAVALHRIFPGASSVSEGVIAHTMHQARLEGIDSLAVQAWEERLPAHLAAAADSGRFNDAYLSLGLLYPHYYREVLDLATPVAKAKWQHLAFIVRQLQAQCQARGMEMGVVFVPFVFQYDPLWDQRVPFHPVRELGAELREEWLHDTTAIQERLQALCRETRLPFLDLTPTLRQAAANGQVCTWGMDLHWNATGHLEAASAMHDWLLDSHLFGLDRSASGREI
ncbi:MAG: hypothetical protein AAGB22_06255 [Bacteroidota bacterium]